MRYLPDPGRYEGMVFNRCGRHGLKLPAISLGLWHNFGGVDVLENQRVMLHRAFDLGITHVDLANNYGPPPGSAEENFGRLMKTEFAGLRDEMVISTKAGFRMWPGPYGEWGSRKNILASLDQSLLRMGLDYVDIMYSHRPDPETPMEETMGALEQAVRQGKALYAGISSYSPDQTRQAVGILKQSGAGCLIHQPSYSIFNRWIEDELLDVLAAEGVGCIAFCPLAQGMLTNRYLDGVPAGSRADKPHGFLKPSALTPARLDQIRSLHDVARERGQSLAQMALSWVLRDPRVTSALIGASRPEQIEENVKAISASPLTAEELGRIDDILRRKGL